MDCAMDLNDWLERLEGKLERMDARSEARHEKTQERLNDMGGTLVRQALTLEDHVRRSIANEEAVELLRAQLRRRWKVTPALVAKCAGAVAALGAAVSAALRALGKI